MNFGRTISLLLATAVVSVPLAGQTAKAPAASGGYKAKSISVSVRDMGGTFSVKIPKEHKTVKIKQKTEWVSWTIQPVPRGGKVRIDMKDLTAPPVSCHAASATSWSCTSSTFFLKSEAGLTPEQLAVAKTKAVDEKYEYNVVLTVGGKDYVADPFIIVQR